MRSPRASRGSRRIIATVAVGAMLVSVGLLGWRGRLRWACDPSVVSLARGWGGAGAATGEALGNVGHIRDLARNNTNLARENAALRQRLAADAETRRDNELLRRQLGLDVAAAPKQVAAEVVAFEPASYRQFITINKGSKAGLKAGQAALSEGVLAGVLTDVQPDTAKIRLVTDPEFKLTAKDQDTGALGIVQGQLGSGLTMDKIGQTETVHPGDTVTTSGLGGQVPSGLLIGQIQSVAAQGNAVFQSARLATELKPSSLRFVFVVTP